ncbi:MOSC domain-containing protein [Siculibacillus lacustris]|uniref:MOSC domain-containing protein n=1 Tax=Siculibacillus lacustris TaxID=1549641 RepID=A0A4Q9VUG4_9HYPH|nr:MOSC domain-containing protein [Siculibacillus lacustris]TBW39795.1 MOSC domain-containing protein [Siculibacillus lacustris]
MIEARVIAVAADDSHAFSKPLRPSIRLLAGRGVEGDAHCGETVQHRSRVAVDPSAPNLRQIHLIPAELFDDPLVRPFALAPGDLGENVTTTGLDLLALPRGTRLRLGATAVIEVTSLRNPCAQIDAFRPGLHAAVLGRAADGGLIRKAGVMAIVRVGGEVAAGDEIVVEPPPQPWAKLERV